MLKIVVDASTLVGTLLKRNSIPEQAVLLARSHGTIFLSPAVDTEIREVFARPKFRKYLLGDRAVRFLDVLAATSSWVIPVQPVADCPDSKDNKYLELALAAPAGMIVSSDDDLLLLHPWRGVAVLSPRAFVELFAVPSEPAQR